MSLAAAGLPWTFVVGIPHRSAMATVARLLQHLQLRGIECQTGDFFSVDAAQGSFAQRQAYRDRVMDQSDENPAVELGSFRRLGVIDRRSVLKPASVRHTDAPYPLKAEVQSCGCSGTLSTCQSMGTLKTCYHMVSSTSFQVGERTWGRTIAEPRNGFLPAAPPRWDGRVCSGWRRFLVTFPVPAGNSRRCCHCR